MRAQQPPPTKGSRALRRGRARALEWVQELDWVPELDWVGAAPHGLAANGEFVAWTADAPGFILAGEATAGDGGRSGSSHPSSMEASSVGGAGSVTVAGRMDLKPSFAQARSVVMRASFHSREGASRCLGRAPAPFSGAFRVPIHALHAAFSDLVKRYRWDPMSTG